MKDKKYLIIILLVPLIILAGCKEKEQPVEYMQLKLFIIDKITTERLDGEICVYMGENYGLHKCYNVRKDVKEMINLTRTPYMFFEMRSEGYYNKFQIPQGLHLTPIGTIPEVMGRLYKISDIDMEMEGKLEGEYSNLSLTFIPNHHKLRGAKLCVGHTAGIVYARFDRQISFCNEWLNYSFYNASEKKEEDRYYWYEDPTMFRCIEDKRVIFCDVVIDKTKCFTSNPAIPVRLFREVTSCLNVGDDFINGSRYTFDMTIKTFIPHCRDRVYIYVVDEVPRVEPRIIGNRLEVSKSYYEHPETKEDVGKNDVLIEIPYSC